MNEDSFKGVAEWLISAVNATLAFLGQLVVLVGQDPPRAAIAAGGLVLTLAIIGSIRAWRRRRSARRAVEGEVANNQPLPLDTVQVIARRNGRLRR